MLSYVQAARISMRCAEVIRATEDVDLFLRATRENIDRFTMLRAVHADDPHIDEITSDDLLGEYPAVRYYPPGGGLFIDIMTRLGEAATFETVAAEIKEIDGIRVSVATPEALYRMKRGTVRPIDRHDAAAIRERF